MKIPTDLERAFTALPANFYGSLELTFQGGSLVLLKQTITTKMNGTTGNYANAK